MFINCHRKQGFTTFYKELDHLAIELRSKGISLNNQKLQRNQRLILVIAVVYRSAEIIRKILDLSAEELTDPIFGKAWNNQNYSYEIHITGKVLSHVIYLPMTVHWVLYPAFFLSSCYYCWHMLSEFNKTFKSRVESLTRQTVLEIEMYRTVHLKLCEFVNQTNDLFHVMLGNMMLNYAAIILLLLHLLATSEPHLTTPVETLSMIYWILGPAGLSVIYILFSQNVSEKVRDS